MLSNSVLPLPVGLCMISSKSFKLLLRYLYNHLTAYH
ncbi:hypothetical protein MGSAQ_000413 [marine sediment metagenome]|uniref:Uncharacterized protein n=1 Tax=marine sediment metagenome TaxID=412755 RepID=A0A1B6NXI3_9ZZZZ